jgi:hypothetical protein
MRLSLSSCLVNFLPNEREGDGFVVVLAGHQAVTEAAEQAAEQPGLKACVRGRCIR